jgi:hypothetical protein
MGYFQDEMEEAVGKKWAKRIGFVVILFGLYFTFALVFSFWPFNVAKEVVNKVVNANAIVQNYEWFYDQYNAIKAQQANIAVMPKDARELPGMKMVLNNAIAEYNSKSKQITRNLWKADDLPYQITIGE